MWTINPVSKQLETTFQGILMSVAPAPQTNSNGTEFRVGSVKLPTGKTVSCRIYEKNYNRPEGNMTIGESYRCTATQYKDTNGNPGIDVTMSHLTQAARASVDDFAFAGEEVAIPANVATAEAVA
jgi:hypothetical protein